MKIKITAAALLMGSVALAAHAQDTAKPEQQIAAMKQQLAALAHQATLLSDEKAIEKLQRAYGYYVDKKMWDDVTDLFVDEGSIELGFHGVFIGKPHIRHSLELFGPQGLKDGDLFNHLQLQPIVHVADDGKTAKARWRAFTEAGTYGKRAVWGEGVYENEYVKQDGVWKIQSLHFYDSFATDYSKGWAKEVLPPEVPPKKGFEPDQPMSVKYDHFPKYFLPPFHYMNPVTGKPPQTGAAQTGEGAK